MTRATRRRSRTAVDVVVLDAGWGKALPGVERLVRKAARAATANRKHSLTVALADDRRVRALNARDRKKDKPTNVLSYPSGERDGKSANTWATSCWRARPSGERPSRKARRPPITSSISSCMARFT
jgi:ssRNA-specific RNase YbeY (16S rRNA maturation enzyme)